MSKKIIKATAKELPLKEETGVATNSTKPGIMIGTLNVFTSPAKNRYERFYQPEKNSWWWHLGVDLLLFILIITLAIFDVMNFIGRPETSPYYPPANNSTSAQPQISIEISKDREIVRAGDQPIYTVKYSNQSKSAISDLIITLKLEGQVIGGQKQFVLSSSEFPELKNIAPQTKGEIKKTIGLNKNIEQPIGTNLILTATIEANYKNSTGQEFNTAGNKILQKTTTRLVASAFARYALPEGDQLGIGPLPPKVGQPTRYWIFFSADTDFNDLKNLSFSAEVPAGIRPTGQLTATSDQPAELNAERTEINWQVKLLKAPSKNYPQVGTGFEVEIIPTTEQIGKPADLLTKIRVLATDAFTGEIINIELPNITSAIKEDASGGVIKSN